MSRTATISLAALCLLTVFAQSALAQSPFPLQRSNISGSLVGWDWNWGGEWDLERGVAPWNPPAGDNYIAVTASQYHAVALLTDGSLVAWGDNVLVGGALLDIPAGNDFVAISAGTHHTLALRSNGSIVGWGANSWGQASTPPYDDFTAVATGTFHSVGLRADGSVYAWGYDEFVSVLDVPEGTGFIAVAAAQTGFSAALHGDGSLHYWGRPDYYGYPEAESGVIEGPFSSIAASSLSINAIYEDGSLFTTGGFGIENLPDGHDFAFFANGTGDFALAIRDNGSLAAWGEFVPSPPEGNDFVFATYANFFGLAIKAAPTATDLLVELIQDVDAINLINGLDNSLDAKLDNALDAFDAENTEQRQDAIYKVQAFINSVQAQKGKKISIDEADHLIDSAEMIIQKAQN